MFVLSRKDLAQDQLHGVWFGKEQGPEDAIFLILFQNTSCARNRPRFKSRR